MKSRDNCKTPGLNISRGRAMVTARSHRGSQAAYHGRGAQRNDTPKRRRRNHLRRNAPLPSTKASPASRLPARHTVDFRQHPKGCRVFRICRGGGFFRAWIGEVSKTDQGH